MTHVHRISSEVKRAATSRAAAGAWRNSSGERHGGSSVSKETNYVSKETYYGGSRSGDGLVDGLDVLARSLFLLY